MQGSSFRLIVRRGPRPNEVYELSKAVMTLGRDITNDIVINDPEVSRHHCRLTQSTGGCTIEDLGSTNGTFINGQRLTGARPLQPGDTVGLGETVTLAFEGAMIPRGVEPSQAATMVGGGQPGDYMAQPGVPPYGAPPYQAVPPTPSPYQASGGVMGQPGVPPYGAPAQPPYAAQSPYAPTAQQPVGYEAYDYQQQEDYESPGPGRWVVLGCGCFLVLCIVTSVIGGIIIDAKCWWDDIPVISEMFDLGIRADATCR